MPRPKTDADEKYNEKRRQARAEARAKGERIASDEAYRIRRRLQTQLKKADSQLKAAKKSKDKAAISEAKKLVSGLKRDIKNTYKDKKTKTYKNIKNIRAGVSDRVFADAMNAAKKGITLFGLSKRDVSIFWKKTKDLWQGKIDRYDAIKKGLGVDSLKDAFDKIMNGADVEKAQKQMDEYSDFKKRGATGDEDLDEWDTTAPEYVDATYDDDEIYSEMYSGGAGL